MPVPEIDSGRIFAAILAAGVTSPKSVEVGSELLDVWSAECVIADQRYRTLGLEVGWFIALDERTFVVGACDKVAWEPGSENTNPFVFEAKTTAAGSKNWGPERWYDELYAGHQVATYAVALRQGTFIVPGHWDTLQSWGVYNLGVSEWTPEVASPRVLARAVSKSKPAMMWPTAEGSWMEFSAARLNATLSAYRNAAAAIRAQRATTALPWSLAGRHCTKQFGMSRFPCEFWKPCHETFEFVRDSGGARQLGLSPGSDTVVDHLITTGRIPIDKRIDDYVVLSGSSLSDWQWCPERWRQRSVGAPEQPSEAMETGTVFHAGVAEYSRILKENGY